jgi:hypothetical protein
LYAALLGNGSPYLERFTNPPGMGSAVVRPQKRKREKRYRFSRLKTAKLL